MRIIEPIEVNDDTLRFSNIDEDDDGYPEWERGYVFNEHLLLTQSAGDPVRCYYKTGSTHTYQDIIDTSDFDHVSTVSLNPQQTVLLVFGERNGYWGVYKYKRSKTSAGVTYEYVEDSGVVALFEDSSFFEYVALAWSPDGRYLAVATRHTPRTLNVFYFNGAEFLQLAMSGGSLDANSYAFDVSFSKDSRFLAVSGLAGATSAKPGRLFRIYEVLDRFSAVEKQVSSNIAYLHWDGYVEFSPSDQLLVRTFLYATDSVRAQVLSYDGSGTFTEETDALGIGITTPLFGKPTFSFDGVYLCCKAMHKNDWDEESGINEERLYFYEYDGGTFSVITDPDDTPGAEVRHVKFSKTDYHVYVFESGSPYFHVYLPNSVGVFQQITGPTTMPGLSNIGMQQIETANISSWGLGSIVKKGDYLYESLKSGNLADPAEDTSVKSWIEISPINRLKMFDEYANTKTTAEDPIVVQIEAVGTAHIGLVGLSGASEVMVRRYDALDAVQWTETTDTDGLERVIIDIDQATTEGEYVEIIIGSEGDGNISISRCVPGFDALEYKYLQYGLEYSPISFGIVKENDFGNVFLKQGTHADYFECELYINKTQYDDFTKLFRNYRETNLLWDLNGTETEHESLITYGFYYGRPRFKLVHPNDYVLNFRIREFT